MNSTPRPAPAGTPVPGTPVPERSKPPSPLR